MTATATKPRQPELKTSLPGPKTAEIMARDAQHLSTSYMRPYPFVPDHGEGVWLTDVDGNTMLDFFAGIAVSTTPTFREDMRREGLSVDDVPPTDPPQTTPGQGGH